MTIGTSSDYTPLPDTVTDFIAENLCGILEIPKQHPHQPEWDPLPSLPELLYFIRKVTTKAKIDVKTAIASLVLVMRFKKRLPKAARGGHGTYHKIFLTSLLIALKEFMPKTEEEEKEEREEFEESLDSNTTDDTNEISNARDINNVDSDTNSNLSASPSPSIISTTPSSTAPSDDEQEDDVIFRDNSQPSNGFNYRLKRPIITKKLCHIILPLYHLYDEEEVERMEREFMWRINGEDKVTDNDIRDYVEANRHALGRCE